MVPRPCERQCAPPERGGCGLWKHFSRFRSWTDYRNVSDSVTFSVFCRDCETKERNERKNEDRPLWILKQRTKAYATKYSVNFDFMWVNMNWQALIAFLRAMMTPEGLCTNCGHPFDNERDIQLDHNEPPRHDNDWARLHARNISIRCGSCNRGKSDTPYAQWLDDQELARLSNQEAPSPSLERQPSAGPLFEWRKLLTMLAAIFIP